MSATEDRAALGLPVVLDTRVEVAVDGTRLECVRQTDGTWVIDTLNLPLPRVGTIELSRFPALRHRDKQAAVEAAGMLARELARIEVAENKLRRDCLSALQAYAVRPPLGGHL